MTPARQARRKERKANGGGSSGLLSAFGGGALNAAVQKLQGVAEQLSTPEIVAKIKYLEGVAAQIPMIEGLIDQVNHARGAAAVALEEFARLEYELTKQRYVSMRLKDVSTTNLTDLLLWEEQMRVEYDIIQALVILLARVQR